MAARRRDRAARRRRHHVGATLLTRTGTGGASKRRVVVTQKGAPELDLDLGLRTDVEAVALRRALDLLRPQGTASAPARSSRATDSLEARVGAALAAWPGGFDRHRRARPASIRAARSRSSSSGSRSSGRGGSQQAQRAWRVRERLEPDTSTRSVPTTCSIPRYATGHCRPSRPRSRRRRELDRLCPRRSSSRTSAAARADGRRPREAALRRGAAEAPPACLGRAGVRRRRAGSPRTIPTRRSQPPSASSTRRAVAGLLEARPARPRVPEGDHRALPPRADADLDRAG